MVTSGLGGRKTGLEVGPEFGDGTGTFVFRACKGAVEEFLPARRSLRDERGDWGEAPLENGILERLEIGAVKGLYAA